MSPPPYNAPQIETTMTNCAGAAASFALQSIGVVAGCYREGPQDRLLRDVRISPNGSSLQNVINWLKFNNPELQRIGYRIHHQRVSQAPEVLCGWVANGTGLRAAVIATDRFQLYPGATMSGSHAVVLIQRMHPDLRESRLVMVDPWPYTTTELTPPDTLMPAARALNHASLIFYWAGWS